MTAVHSRINTNPRGRFLPRFPRMRLGPFWLVPATDSNWDVVPNQWHVPGRDTWTTQQCRQHATRKGWACDIFNHPIAN